MILLIRISSGAGNTQHLLASASVSASWVTVRRGEQTVPGSLFVPFVILYGTCYERHLDCVEFCLTASRTVPWESQHVTQASSRDTLIINHPLNLICSLSPFSVFISDCLWTDDEQKYAKEKIIFSHARWLSPRGWNLMTLVITWLFAVPPRDWHFCFLVKCLNYRIDCHDIWYRKNNI